MLAAVIATEDSQFYKSSGLRPAPPFACHLAERRRRGAAHASTITQQIARNLLYPGGSGAALGLRKIREILLAAEITPLQQGRDHRALPARSTSGTWPTGSKPLPKPTSG
jgi:membrane carboxypeptidase/penicillin-binding protein